jgi:hypothetical protein
MPVRMPGYKRLPPTAVGRLHIEDGDGVKASIVNRWAPVGLFVLHGTALPQLPLRQSYPGGCH